MEPYEIIEHTADVGIKVYGVTLKELFENAAKGMFAIIIGEEAGSLIRLEEQRDIYIKKEAKGLEELLVDWLSELLYLFHKEQLLFGRFKIEEINNDGLKGEAQGERISSARVSPQTEIKAVTFHNLKVEEKKNGFSCNIIFDV